jgi:hypothetical protein
MTNMTNERERIIDRIKSMSILCIFCNNPNRLSLSVIEYQSDVSESYASAFLICPECRNKFMIKIVDLGKVRGWKHSWIRCPHAFVRIVIKFSEPYILWCYMMSVFGVATEDKIMVRTMIRAATNRTAIVSNLKKLH